MNKFTVRLICVLIPIKKWRKKLRNKLQYNIKMDNWIKVDLKKFKKLGKGIERFTISEKDFIICNSDKTTNTEFNRHYLYHTAWAIRKIKESGCKLHSDIGSCLRFVTCLSAYVNVDFYDYRPPKIILSGLKLIHGNLTNLKTVKSNSIESLSCMHVIEHIGLGRYGDEVDYNGDLKSIAELKRVLKVGGNLFFVVPIANKPYIAFNAHRVYTKEQILDYFKDLSLEEFSLIQASTDNGIIKNPSQSLLNEERWGCGCFHFRKKL